MMKRFFFLLVLGLMSISGFSQTLKFSSAMPEWGKSLKFVYDPKGGNLANFTAVKCEVKALTDRDSRQSFPVALKKVGSLYEGEFTPKDPTALVVLIFSANGNIDENPKGYYTKIYSNGVPIPMGVFLEGHLYSGFGHGLAKIVTDQRKATALYADAFKADPLLKEKYLNNYLASLLKLNKSGGERAISDVIAEFNRRQPSEQTAQKVLTLYYLLNRSTSIDSMQLVILRDYPKGDQALAQAIKGLRSFKQADQKEQKFNELIKEFDLSLSNPVHRSKLNSAFIALADAYAVSSENAKTEFYTDLYEPKLTRAIFYNNFVKRNLANQVNLEFSAKMSKKSVELIDELKKEVMPVYFESTPAYLSYVNGFYTPHVITYARILSAIGKNEEALAVIEPFAKNSGDNAEMNDLYVQILAKNGRSEQTVAKAKELILQGYGSEAIKANLKASYRGDEPFDQFYARLANTAEASQRAKFAKEMINVPAPNFVLNNLNGEKVELGKLRGKVVIIDYWATWCGPCIASFPGMQKAVDKYKSDPKVVFLFINTWQKETDREKSVQDWMHANPKFTFNVLLDKNSNDGLDRYEVVEKYKVSAIPTKFIIDRNGYVRFKTEGAESTPEAIVKELDMMISLAKQK